MGEHKEADPLAAKLAKCRPFLRKDYESIDPRLPGLLKILQARGAGECWHKHGTFFAHLLDTYRILKLWGSSDTVALFGLFHSSYSNSYVNLAIFAPDIDRSVLRGLIGDEAEELVHMFCIIPRQELVFDRLLHKLSDDDLRAGLKQYQGTKAGSEVNGKSTHDKRRLFVPTEGIVLKHIRTGEDVVLPRRLVALFVLLTMADFIDQLYGWQDALFKNDDGEFRWAGNEWHALWPGSCKPGLFLTLISRMGVLLNILLHEDAAERAELHGAALTGLPEPHFGSLEIPVPAIFNNCTEILPAVDQNRSREQYWEAMHFEQRDRIVATAVPLLKSACKINPFVAEPHLVLAQIYCMEGKFELAEAEATEGVRLLLDWATNWDKRMTWEGWLSFGRVLRENAHEKTWPQSAFGVLSLGLVK
ncbi:hypothetical protein M758_2G029600 [Ceratodon purpureus]|uniref:DUF6817 domain-containing protein n=1 Tax=Ceratodon purpureus TaxID=3225 RepID=A0A8T0IR94_CERPU|nr:hypothetical protein KC19_2G030100 [Ceratodon purpureus]KAG0625123.1 hypothetical protein M758_2G029600 [Ceratodon purpureus]